MCWNSECCASAVDAYFLNKYSVIAPSVPSEITLMKPCCLLGTFHIRNQYLMGHYIQTNCECDKTKNLSLSAHQITWERRQHWRASILWSPWRSACKHASALEHSNRSVRPILHRDLIIILQVGDCRNTSITLLNSLGNASEALIKNASEDVIFFCFFGENEFTVTVNSDQSVFQHAGELFFTRLDELDLGEVWFEQGRATTHNLRGRGLFWHFPECLISIRQDLEWPLVWVEIANIPLLC